MRARYFYICRKGNFVRGIDASYMRTTISSTYTNKLTILELYRKATDEEINKHELIFLCQGVSIKDELVQKKIRRYS